jgi:hypothetical protein
MGFQARDLQPAVLCPGVKAADLQERRRELQTANSKLKTGNQRSADFRTTSFF